MAEHAGPNGKLRSRLEETLAGAFVVERELGGGGMSRVFVAEETRLGRKVVVKVLSPELAEGISVERFEREIRLAASLQHAHIVPVLATGEVDGLPWFTMPFIEGESLRQRVGRGALPIGECISILRDMARALTYAHGRDVVHRDIKPDNVMFSAGSAVVTDFGIAKALSASRTGTGSETLTQLGTSIGTPAYMAPEQAAGDPNVDARADIYAFGCTAYELLTGSAPFAGRTPQRMLAAHMAEVPRDVRDARGDTPPVLAELVMRSLAKDASDRPQTAAEIARALDTVTSGSMRAQPAILLDGAAMFRRALLLYVAAFVAVLILAKAAIVGIGLPDWVFPGSIIVMALGLPVILFTAYAQRVQRLIAAATPTRTPGGTASVPAPRGTMATIAMRAAPYVGWQRAARAATVAIVLFALGVGGFMALRALGIGPAGSLIGAGKLAAQDQVIVADFKATGADSAIGSAAAELMRSSLQQSHAVRLMPASAIARSLERMKRPADTKLDVPLATAMAQREGAKAVVTGGITRVGRGWLVEVQLLAAASGDVLWSSHRAVADADEFVAAYDGLARELRGKIGESLRAVQSSPPLAHVTTSSMEALEMFTQGAHAADIEGDNRKAIILLNQAIALDSTFAMAYRKLYVALKNYGGNTEQSAGALERGLAYVGRLPEAERLAYLATYYGAPNTAHADRARAAAAYEELFRRFPEWKVIITETLMATLAASRRDYARAESLSFAVMQTAPDEANPYTNIVNYQIDEGKFAEAAQSIARDRQRRPDNPMADYREGELWYNQGWRDSARIAFGRASRSSNTEHAALGHQALASMDLGEGQLTESLRERAIARASDASRGRTTASAFSDSLDRAQRLIRILHRPADAIRLLDAMVAKAGPSRRPSLVVAETYAMAGQSDSARAELARYDASQPDTALVRRQAGTRHTVAGWIAAAQGKYSDAITEFRLADRLPDGPASSCGICTDYAVASSFDRAGMPDSAVKYFEHFARTPYSDRMANDGMDLPTVYQRLAALYESKRDAPRAAEYYRRFIDLYRNADPELQPMVAEARQRLAHLGDVPTSASIPKP